MEVLVVIERKKKKRKKNHRGEREQVVKGEILSKVSAIGGSMFGFKKNLKLPLSPCAVWNPTILLKHRP